MEREAPEQQQAARRGSRRDPRGHADREHERPEVPQGELSSDDPAPRRPGGQKGPDEELTGAEHELRHAPHEGEVQGEPPPLSDAGHSVDHSGRGAGHEIGHAQEKEGGEQVGRPQVTGRDHSGAARSPGRGGLGAGGVAAHADAPSAAPGAMSPSTSIRQPAVSGS